MQQTLTSSMITALLSAICYGIAKNIYGVSPGWVTLKTVLIWCGIIFGIYAVIGGCLIVADNLRSHWYALGDVMERLMHPEIALVTAMGRLDQDQLNAYLQESGKLIFFVSDGKADWAIRSKGRELSSDWVSAYLYKCENHIPSSELPAVSSHAPKSQIYANETAMIAHLRGMKFCQFRPGQNDLWIDGHTPETVRELYF